jgi:hypothetical protein
VVYGNELEVCALMVQGAALRMQGTAGADCGGQNLGTMGSSQFLK